MKKGRELSHSRLVVDGKLNIKAGRNSTQVRTEGQGFKSAINSRGEYL